jgi:hypothetical protein
MYRVFLHYVFNAAKSRTRSRGFLWTLCFLVFVGPLPCPGKNTAPASATIAIGCELASTMLSTAQVQARLQASTGMRPDHQPRLAQAHTASIRGAIRSISKGLVERDAEARLLLLAALSGEHVLFLGPPGTAKSELARRLHTCLEGSSYFERLLTRFSVPEEMFGPLSMRALEQDLYLRNTEGYLPEVQPLLPRTPRQGKPSWNCYAGMVNHLGKTVTFSVPLSGLDKRFFMSKSSRCSDTCLLAVPSACPLQT